MMGVECFSVLLRKIAVVVAKYAPRHLLVCVDIVGASLSHAIWCHNISTLLCVSLAF